MTICLRAPVDTCIQRNLDRGTQQVPLDVIQRMNGRLEWPDGKTHPWEQSNLELDVTYDFPDIGAVEQFVQSILDRPLIFIDLKAIEEEREKSRTKNINNSVHAMDEVLRTLVGVCISSLRKFFHVSYSNFIGLAQDFRKTYSKVFSLVKAATLAQLKPQADVMFKQSHRLDFERWIEDAFKENISLSIPLNINIF